MGELPGNTLFASGEMKFTEERKQWPFEKNCYNGPVAMLILPYKHPRKMKGGNLEIRWLKDAVFSNSERNVIFRPYLTRPNCNSSIMARDG